MEKQAIEKIKQNPDLCNDKEVLVIIDNGDFFMKNNDREQSFYNTIKQLDDHFNGKVQFLISSKAHLEFLPKIGKRVDVLTLDKLNRVNTVELFLNTV